jgi:hypothetical protein
MRPRRSGMVVEIAEDDLSQPFSLLGNWLVHAPSHRLLDHLELHPQAVAPGLPLELEVATARCAADEGEAQEVEGLRLAEPTLLAVFRRKASELATLAFVSRPIRAVVTPEHPWTGDGRGSSWTNSY